MRMLLPGLVAALALAGAAPVDAATVDVRITRTAFSPRTVTISAGDAVAWRNADTQNHQIVADDGSFASPILRPGGRYTFTFRVAGRYGYHDALRPSIRGTIVVRGPPPSVTLGASQPIVVYGGQATLTGVVSNQRSGETVTLFQQPHGAAAQIQLAVVLTGAGGGYAFSVKPELLTTYQARWRTAASATVVVQVKPKVSFRRTGRRFYAKVEAARSFAGRFVYLQRLSPLGQWVSVRKLSLGPLSGRLFEIRRGSRAWSYRVFLTVNQAGAGYLDSRSGTQRVGARRRG